VSAPGGRTVRAFQSSRQLPPPLRWLNRDTLSEIDRAQDLTINWAPDGHTPDDVLTVTITGANLAPATVGAVTCRAPASAGELTVPGSLLGRLARTPFIGQLQLRLTPRPDRRVRFEMPLTAGATERGVHEYLFTDTLRLTIR
jgi:hypothetical protein